MRPKTTPFLSLLLLGLAACGGGSDPAAQVDAGYSALNSGDHAAAISSFEGALGGLEPGTPKHLEAKLGQIQALCHTDPARARGELTGLSKDSGVQAADYNKVVTELVAAAQAKAATSQDEVVATINEAVAILTEGKSTFPDYDKWDALIKKTGDRAASLGSGDALEALKGLGYVGGD